MEDSLVNPHAVHLKQSEDWIVVRDIPRWLKNLILLHSLILDGPHIRAPEKHAVGPCRDALAAEARTGYLQLEGRRKWRAHRTVQRRLEEGMRSAVGAAAQGLAGPLKQQTIRCLEHVDQLIVLDERTPGRVVNAALDMLAEVTPGAEFGRLRETHVCVAQEENGAVCPQRVHLLIVELELDALEAVLHLLRALIEVLAALLVRARFVRMEVAVYKAETPVIEREAARHDAFDATEQLVCRHLKHAETVHVRANQFRQAENAEEHTKEINWLAEKHVHLVLVPPLRGAIAVLGRVDGVPEQLHPLHNGLRPAVVQKTVNGAPGCPNHGRVHRQGYHLLQAHDDDVGPVAAADAQSSCQELLGVLARGLLDPGAPAAAAVSKAANVPTEHLHSRSHRARAPRPEGP
mmetsp:Transcript_85856/g.243459  ORF Transcript_85856/g.243459 Transcript_85856/m.243459 type:complete len:405 (+) Transcript_85856:453-1667(+)